MWAWLKKVLLGSKSDDRVKSFDDEMAGVPQKEFRRVGQASIKTGKIVGSVGRAHELDSSFHYRERARTDRYHSINDSTTKGKPMSPIKVARVKRDRGTTEYYVIDGHHRVAEAKKKGFDEINADVTDVVIPSESLLNEIDENATSET